MALHVRGHLGFTIAKLLLQELDDPLDARTRCRMRQAQALTLGGQHLHQLAPAQHQGLQLLQLGIGQRLDEAFTLGVLVQHAGEGRQHARIQRVGLGQAPIARAKSRAVRGLTTATASPAACSAQAASNS